MTYSTTLSRKTIRLINIITLFKTLSDENENLHSHDSKMSSNEESISILKSF